MGKRKRVFKARMKHYPSIVRDGITHVYPFPNAKTTKVVEQDRLYFLANPDVRSYQRPYVPGEFEGCPIPNDIDLAEVAYVQVFRLGSDSQARIPLPREDTL